MPVFEYEALDNRGRKTRGLITADTALSARRELRQQSLAPLSIGNAESQAQRASQEVRKSWADPLIARDLTQRDLMLTTRQLASLIGAGIPVEEALDLVGRQYAKHTPRRILMSVRAKVTEGKRLVEALASFPRSFPPVYRALVAAGEMSGGLGDVLARLAEYLEKEQAIRNRVLGALIYPMVLSVVAMGVVTLLLLVVVPRIAEQFTGMGVDLPSLTLAVMGLAGFLQNHGPLLVLLIGGLIIAGIMGMQRDTTRRWIDRALGVLPGLGGFIRDTEAARFARTMAILLNSGTVMAEALRAARQASQNLVFQDRLSQVIGDIEVGRSLSESLMARGGMPTLMVYMVAAGERSGQLGEMFARAADQLDQDVDGGITIGLNLLEPGIILVLGGIVVLIVLSILLPILKLNTMTLG